jgi:hypothetical protein
VLGACVNQVHRGGGDVEYGLLLLRHHWFQELRIIGSVQPKAGKNPMSDLIHPQRGNGCLEIRGYGHNIQEWWLGWLQRESCKVVSDRLITDAHPPER